MADDWQARAKKQGFSVGPMPVPDGSRVEVTDAEIVPMGDVFAHRQLTYTHAGDADRPACKIVFEVRDRARFVQASSWGHLRPEVMFVQEI